MFSSIITVPISLSQFLLCIGTALVLGILGSLILTYRRFHTGSLAYTLALLPAAVTVVIMMVNGNVGAGIAVAGSFALVRFRSVPASARDILGIFVSVALGLACGMGYLLLAALFLAIFSLACIGLTVVHFGEGGSMRQLKITIPENLDYDELFDDIFEKYTHRCDLIRVRTTNMGTLFELTYSVKLKDPKISKSFMDELRCRNGNLNIICGRDLEKDLI